MRSFLFARSFPQFICFLQSRWTGWVTEICVRYSQHRVGHGEIGVQLDRSPEEGNQLRYVSLKKGFPPMLKAFSASSDGVVPPQAEHRTSALRPVTHLAWFAGWWRCPTLSVTFLWTMPRPAPWPVCPPPCSSTAPSPIVVAAQARN